MWTKFPHPSSSKSSAIVVSHRRQPNIWTGNVEVIFTVAPLLFLGGDRLSRRLYAVSIGRWFLTALDASPRTTVMKRPFENLRLFHRVNHVCCTTSRATSAGSPTVQCSLRSCVACHIPNRLYCLTRAGQSSSPLLASLGSTIFRILFQMQAEVRALGLDLLGHVLDVLRLLFR